MSDRPTSVYLLVEEDERPPWREYVVGVYFDHDRARVERDARQDEEDESGALARYRYTVQRHWVHDASWDAVASAKQDRPEEA